MAGLKIADAYVEVGVEDQTKGDLNSIGASMAAWAGGLGLGALIGKGLTEGLNIEQGLANVTAQFNLTKSEAQVAGKAAGDLYKNNFGGSLDEVTNVIGQVGESLGGLSSKTEGEAKKVSGYVLTMADVFGVDATQAIQSMDVAVSQGLAPSLANASDVATRVFQEGGPKAQEFLEVINEYAPNLKNAGLSMEDFGSMSVAYLDAGGFSIDQFADSIREMTIRVADGSAESSGAFKTLGLDADKMTADMAAGGPRAEAAFKAITQGLVGIEDPVLRNTTGAQLFGSMWEDSSGAILAGLAPVPGALGEVSGASQQMADTVGDTGAAKIETMKRQMEGWLTSATQLPGPLGSVVAATAAVGGGALGAMGSIAQIGTAMAAMGGTAVATAAKTVGAWASSVASAAAATASTVASMVVQGAKWVWLGVQAMASAARIAAAWLISLGPIAIVIAAVVGLAVLIYKNFDEIKEFIGKAWEWVKDKTSAIWDGIKSALTATWDAIKAAVTAYFTAYKTVITTIWEAVKTAVLAVWNAIKTALLAVWEALKTAITTYFNAYKTVVTTVFDAIKTVATTVWNAIKTVITTVMDAIKTVITTVWNAIKTFITGWLENVKANITTAWNAIKTVITTVVNAIQAVITSVWNAIKSTITGVVSAVSGAVTSGFNGIKNTITNAVNGAKTAATTAFNAIKKVVSDAIANVVSTITGLKSKIMSALSGAGSWLVDAGESIIRGLIRGITNMTGAVKDAVSGVLKKARDLLPFSPAKEGPFSGKGWTLYSGQAISESLGEGIASKIGAVRSATASLVGAASDGLSGLSVPGVGVSGVSSGLGGAGSRGGSGAAGAGSSRTIQVENIVLQINGSVDFTSPTEKRRFIEEIRTGLINLEREYA